MNLPAFIEEKGQLAAIYADDGALHTAARILRETADTVAQRASEKDALLAALLTKDDPINLQGSGPAPIEPREG